jgi:hypothetical protein
MKGKKSERQDFVKKNNEMCKEEGRGGVFENDKIVWYDAFKEERWDVVICEGLWMSE